MGRTNTTRDEVGDSRRLTFTVRGSTGNLVNAAVTLKVRTPSGAVTTLTHASTAVVATPVAVPSTLAHTAVGTWVANVLSTEAGRYAWLFRSTGAVHTSTGGAWAVAPSPVTT